MDNFYLFTLVVSSLKFIVITDIFGVKGAITLKLSFNFYLFCLFYVTFFPPLLAFFEFILLNNLLFTPTGFIVQYSFITCLVPIIEIREVLFTYQILRMKGL